MWQLHELCYLICEYLCEIVELSVCCLCIVGIEYKPSLPVIKQHVWQRMPPGHITKVVVTYKKVTEH